MCYRINEIGNEIKDIRTEFKKFVTKSEEAMKSQKEETKGTTRQLEILTQHLKANTGGTRAIYAQKAATVELKHIARDNGGLAA